MRRRLGLNTLLILITRVKRRCIIIKCVRREMKIEYKIHANCSEWDQEIEAEDVWNSDEIAALQTEYMRQLKEQAKKVEWDK